MTERWRLVNGTELYDMLARQLELVEVGLEALLQAPSRVENEGAHEGAHEGPRRRHTEDDSQDDDDTEDRPHEGVSASPSTISAPAGFVSNHAHMRHATTIL